MRRKWKTADAPDLIHALHESCAPLRDVCPCRSRVEDVALWREVIERTIAGGHHARHEAAHSIATLLALGETNPRWRRLLRAIRFDLDRAMRPGSASARSILGMVEHQAGHARTLRSSAQATYRRQRRRLDAVPADEIAEWINELLDLPVSARVSHRHPGVVKLADWIGHRVAFQPYRCTTDAEVLDRAKRWLGEVFVGRTPNDARLGFGDAGRAAAPRWLRRAG